MKRHAYILSVFLMRATLLGVALVALLAPARASAAGSFKLKSTEVQEVSGAWHVWVTIELPKPPATPHMPMKFLFTKTAVYERSLVDNHKDPVLNRMSVNGQNPSVESLDVDFADARGKIFKITRFDFGLTRTRGYEAGEYKMQVHTADGMDVGGSQTIVLKGENPVVDRRSITFNAKDGHIKKIDGVDAGPRNTNEDVAPVQNVDVQATGTAAPFVPPEGYEKTPEEEIKERPKGCGCTIPGGVGAHGAAGLAGAGVLFGLGLRRRRRR